MATWLTHSTSGGVQDSDIQNSIREDLLDFITNIDPVDTPFWSMMAQVRATSTKHEWLQDSLDAVSTAGAIEGESYNAAQLVETVRVDNYTQIIKKDFGISGTNDAVDHAGISTQSAYQTRKAMEELARNTEASLIQGTRATPPQGSSSVARTMDGLSALAGNSTTGVGATGPDETEFNDLLQAIWDDGGKPDTVLASSSSKRTISGYTTTTRIHHHGGPASPNAISRNILVYESDFGTVDIFIERYVDPLDVGYAFEKRYTRSAILRTPRVSRLGKDGDLERYQVLQELTLEVLAFDAAGKWVIL